MKWHVYLLKDHSGSATVLTAVLMFLVVAILALVFDKAHVEGGKNELQNAADAAALAGARALMPLSGAGPPPWPMEDPPPCATAIQAAKDTSVLNYVDQGPKQRTIYIDPTEVTTGHWDYQARTFTQAGSCTSNTNAVEVTARMRGDLPQGSLNMTLATIFGVDTVNPAASAVAAVGFLQNLPKKSPGGFLAVDNDFLQFAWDQWKNKNNKTQKYYLVLGPSLGQTSYEYSDNGGYALPSGEYQSFNPDVRSYMATGTETDVSLADYVDLKNGQMADLVQALQDAVAGANYNLTSAVYGVYEDDFGASVGDAWNEKTTDVDSFWTVLLTKVWKSNEFKHDPQMQQIVDEMFPDPNEQKKIVGIIEWEMIGPVAYGGEPGNGPPSNSYGFKVKLVQ